jgi:hypothetical protein
VSISSSEEAAAILIRVLEAVCRLNHKTLSQKTRSDIARACELLATGDSYDDLLVDLLSEPAVRSDRTTVSFERDDYGDRQFSKWRQQYREDAQ